MRETSAPDGYRWRTAHMGRATLQATPWPGWGGGEGVVTEDDRKKKKEIKALGTRIEASPLLVTQTGKQTWGQVAGGQRW